MSDGGGSGHGGAGAGSDEEYWHKLSLYQQAYRPRLLLLYPIVQQLLERVPLPKGDKIMRYLTMCGQMMDLPRLPVRPPTLTLDNLYKMDAFVNGIIRVLTRFMPVVVAVLRKCGRNVYAPSSMPSTQLHQLASQGGLTQLQVIQIVDLIVQTREQAQAAQASYAQAVHTQAVRVVASTPVHAQVDATAEATNVADALGMLSLTLNKEDTHTSGGSSTDSRRL